MPRYAVYSIRHDRREVADAPSIRAMRSMLWGHGSCRVFRISRNGTETYVGRMETDGSYYKWFTPSGNWYYMGKYGQLTDYYGGRVRY